MFIGEVDLGNDTRMELVIVPLKGSELCGRWKKNTDFLMLCDVQNRRCCVCSVSDAPDRFEEKLCLSLDDAKRLAEWLKNNLVE